MIFGSPSIARGDLGNNCSILHGVIPSQLFKNIKYLGRVAIDKILFYDIRIDMRDIIILFEHYAHALIGSHRIHALDISPGHLSPVEYVNETRKVIF